MGGYFFFSSSVIAATRLRLLRALRIEDPALLSTDEQSYVKFQDDGLHLPDVDAAEAKAESEKWVEEELTQLFSEKDKKPVTLTGVITPIGQNKHGLLVKPAVCVSAMGWLLLLPKQPLCLGSGPIKIPLAWNL